MEKHKEIDNCEYICTKCNSKMNKKIAKKRKYYSDFILSCKKCGYSIFIEHSIIIEAIK